MLKKRQDRRMSNWTEVHTISLAPSRGMQKDEKQTNNFTKFLKNFTKTVLNQRKINQNSCLSTKDAHIGFK
jgi:hypothetical protein